MAPSLLILTAFAVSAPGAQGPERSSAAVRYDLRPGDHLVYREGLDREVTSATGATTTRTEWVSHVVVLAREAGLVQVGIQRNRTALHVLRLREDGKERSEADRRVLEERLAARPAAFSEANWVDATGEAARPWSALREAPSELLPYLHEIEPFPGGSGRSWTRTGGLPLSMHLLAGDPGGERCAVAEGALADPSLRLRARLCGRALEHLEFEGTHLSPPNRKVHETLVFDRLETRRGEAAASWLGDPQVQRGMLSALLASNSPPGRPPGLAALLDSGDEAVQRQALALAGRTEGAPLPTSRLAALVASASERVRALAVRNLSALGPDQAAPLLARARLDPDEAVRRAALAVERPNETDPVLARLAAAVRSGEPLAAEAGCGGSGWAARALLAQRAPRLPPGTTVRWVRSGPFAGEPYVLRVPEDYRGDEPFPLLVYLSGGPGRAMSGALESAEVLDRTGLLVVYPQARGLWWERDSTAAFPAVLRDALDLLNVDTNRVFLAGFSNGGTGALLYAALWPDRWAAVAPLMGGGFPLFGAEPPPAANLSRIPLLFLHGDDDRVIPASSTRETVRRLKHDHPSAPVEMEILKGRGHDVRLGADGPRVLGFLAGQKRDPAPDRVVLETRDLDHPRNSWIEVLEKKRGVARVEATLEPDRTIRVATRGVVRLRLLLRAETVPGDPARPVRVVLDGREAFSGPLEEDCGRLLSSWRVTGDPFLAHSAEIALQAK